MAERVRETGRCVDSVLHTAVATLYSNLVTRPTGRAVRVAIEQRILETPGRSLSILDFSRVEIIDYSCADEVIAKLLLAYQDPTRATEAYFVAKGVSEGQREPIEAVLERRRLLLVTIEDGRAALWGPAPARLRQAWDGLERMGEAGPAELASDRGLDYSTAASWLRRLASRRVAIANVEERYVSLSGLLDSAGSRARG